MTRREFITLLGATAWPLAKPAAFVCQCMSWSDATLIR
jgi:hypothetical protein